MTNVNTNVERLYAATAAGNDGKQTGYVASTDKAAQNDTITIVNANEIVSCNLKIVATGAFEPHTKSGNVITLTSATAGAVEGDIIYKLFFFFSFLETFIYFFNQYSVIWILKI